jgi:hypothetical protein
MGLALSLPMAMAVVSHELQKNLFAPAPTYSVTD